MKVTIISWDNLGYISLVEKEFIAQGHLVHHIKMNTMSYNYPNKIIKAQNAITKTLANYNLKREVLAKSVLQELNKLPHQDIILIVSSDRLPTSIFKVIKTKTSRTIGWFYDAVANYPRIAKMVNYFDKAFTFEPKDADKFNLTLLPNFNPYNKPYNFVNRSPNLYHVSTIRDDRKIILTEIAKQLEQFNFPYKIILKTKEVKKEAYFTITDTKIPLDIVYKNLKKATVQIDIQRKNQEGLSFRVLEAMGMQHKLITTNSAVKKYDFYDSNNILIINPDKIDIPQDFLNQDYQPINEDLYNKYTIRNWVKSILG